MTTCQGMKECRNDEARIDGLGRTPRAERWAWRGTDGAAAPFAKPQRVPPVRPEGELMTLTPDEARAAHSERVRAIADGFEAYINVHLAMEWIPSDTEGFAGGHLDVYISDAL